MLLGYGRSVFEVWCCSSSHLPRSYAEMLHPMTHETEAQLKLREHPHTALEPLRTQQLAVH
jgi:hypothetical protein